MSRHDETGITVSEMKIRFVDGSEDGVIGWASCLINNSLYLNNIAVKKDLSGDITLSFPFRHSKKHLKCHYFKPITSEAAEILKEAVLNELERKRARWG